MSEVTISFEQLVERLPKSPTLVYIDYRDSLDERMEALQKCIHSNNFDEIYDDIQDWMSDCQWDSIQYILDELKKELENEFEFDDGELDALIEEHEDGLKDVLYDRDDSDVIKDLLRNTSDPVAFYDTGHEVLCGWGESAAHYRLERYKIKQLLGIKNSDHDKAIDELIENASYNGELLVYFRTDVKEFITEEEPTYIKFRDAYIAIVNHGNGSGYHVDLPGLSFTLPFNRENIFLCKEVKYSYTYEVCGMSSNWCEDTWFELDYTPPPIEVPRSSINDHIDQQAEYDRVFKEGGCSFGDMNIKRHRNTPYSNNFPCGNTCTKCGTFWID